MLRAKSLSNVVGVACTISRLKKILSFPALSRARHVGTCVLASARQKGPGKRKPMSGSKGLRIAVEGCCHGDLDKIYATLQLLEKREGKKIDLLICCGDFQAVRNVDDLECMACPPKYRDLKTFHRYYNGEAVAPYPTIFIGGNHEASNHLWELYYGGWVAPRIYYLGHAGVINFGGVRIGGLSGIFNAKHYRLGHYEAPPYTESTMRSAYHVRSLDVYRLLQITQPLDVFVSHDWPRGIVPHGDMAQLLRAKPFLRKEVQENSLGSEPAEELLKKLHPDYWFSAHMHVKYAALYAHPPPPGRPIPSAGPGRPAATRFLALDKCLPGRNFLQVVEFPDAEGPKQLSYDVEWLAILRRTHSLMSLNYPPVKLPGMGGAIREPVADTDLAAVRKLLEERNGGAVPDNFCKTAPGHGDPRVTNRAGRMPTSNPRNPQTVALLDMLGLPYNLSVSSFQHNEGGKARTATPSRNPEEIELGHEDDDVDDDGAAARQVARPSVNPEEIGLPDEDDELDDDGAAARQLALPRVNPEEIGLPDEDIDLPDEDEEVSGSGAGLGNPEEIGLPDEGMAADNGSLPPEDADPMFQPVAIHNYPPPG